MKISRAHQVAAVAATLALGVTAALDSTLGTVSTAWADTAPTQYQPWTGGQPNQASQQMIQELKAMVAQAEKDKAASPDFLADLKNLVTRYETAAAAPPATPSQAKPFVDAFADGDYTNNPAWKVSAGSWRVDRSGSNTGLVSKIRQQASLESLLGGILNQPGTSTQPANQDYASIYTKAVLPAAFTFATTLTSGDRYGGLHLGLYQGASAQNQYRITYQPGNQKGLLLQRVSAQGAVTLGSFNGAVNLEDGKVHTLSMTRDSAGKMTVLVDGKLAISASDTAMKGDFDGLLLSNVGGSYWIRKISVQPQI